VPKFDSIDDYLAALPADQRAVVEQIERRVLAVLPLEELGGQEIVPRRFVEHGRHVVECGTVPRVLDSQCRVVRASGLRLHVPTVCRRQAAAHGLIVRAELEE